MHDREKAVQELRKAVDADPKRVEGYAALGAAYMAAGQMPTGKRHTRRPWRSIPGPSKPTCR